MVTIKLGHRECKSKSRHVGKWSKRQLWRRDSMCMCSCSVDTHNFKVAKQLVPPEEGDLVPALSSQYEALYYDANHHGNAPKEYQDDQSERRTLKEKDRNENTEITRNTAEDCHSITVLFYFNSPVSHFSSSYNCCNHNEYCNY